MCLSVYLGSHRALETMDVPDGSLGIEQAIWTPPPLKTFPFIYYLGEKATGALLGCSCLLAQSVTWNERGPSIHMDNSLDHNNLCPFATLRSYVLSALQSNKQVALVCDDSGGIEQTCESDDYDHSIISIDMISSESYLFADPIGSFPWRVFYIAVPGNQV
ncbi:MAG TPA: hypothetical protein DCS30_02180 [Rhizobiales bacterium]|nr:hypothetical protein [Hyphomicrobiales bacterium]